MDTPIRRTLRAISAAVLLGFAAVSTAAPALAQVPGVVFELCPPGVPARDAPTCIVDGDSFRLGGERIELEGIDAPQIDGARCLAELARAVRATEFLAALLNTRRWVMLRSRLDTEGRTVGKVHFGPTTAGEMLINAGLARASRSEIGWCGSPLAP